MVEAVHVPCPGAYQFRYRDARAESDLKDKIRRLHREQRGHPAVTLPFRRPMGEHPAGHAAGGAPRMMALAVRLHLRGPATPRRRLGSGHPVQGTHSAPGACGARHQCAGNALVEQPSSRLATRSADEPGGLWQAPQPKSKSQHSEQNRSTCSARLKPSSFTAFWSHPTDRDSLRPAPSVGFALYPVHHCDDPLSTARRLR